MSARGRTRWVPLTPSRRLVAASAAVNREYDTIHLLTEVDVSEPRRRLAAHRERTGERLSFTAYVVTCFARVCAEHPEMNAFRKGRRLVLLDEVTVNVLLERVLDGERVPDAVGVHRADRLGYRQVHDALRRAQAAEVSSLGTAGGLGWIRFLPDRLLRAVIRRAARTPAVKRRFGVVAVTAVGMFGRGAMWAVPQSSATVALAVGSLVSRPVLIDGALQSREHLCLTLSFDHDLVDGAPAARFAARLSERLASGQDLESLDVGAPGP